MSYQRKLQNSFTSIIKRSLGTFRCEQVVFPEPGENFINSLKSPMLTIIFIFRGAQNLYYRQAGKVKKDQLVPGKIVFAGANCPFALDWKLPCNRLGMSCDNQRISMSWNCLRQGVEGLGILPDLWFPGKISPDSDFWYLLKALDARRQHPADTYLTTHLPELILNGMAEHLAVNDIFPDRQQDTFSKICHYLENNFNTPINRNSVAATFKLNPDYITRIFHAKANTLFSHYLRDLRLHKAEELLKTTKTPVKNISLTCGFSSSSYFIKLFKAKHGIPPAEYRSSARS